MLWMMKVSSLYLREFGNKNFNGPISNWHKTNIIYQHDQNILIMTPNNKLSYEEERSIYYDNIFLFSRKCHTIFHHRLTLWRFFFSKIAGASASATNFASSHLWKITDKNNRFFSADFGPNKENIQYMFVSILMSKYILNILSVLINYANIFS